MSDRNLTSDMRARLRWVRVPDHEVDLERFPDFLIVGPQRTGTTWLHANMRFHPEVFLSEPKEIFFFSRLKTPGDAKYESSELEWYLRFFRDRPLLWMYKQAVCLARYGRVYRPKVKGEATASYAALEPDVIAEIAALNPKLKVIFMVRDPVERAWSHAKKDLARNRGRALEEVAEDDFRAFFRDPYQVRCARYAENIENWASQFSRDRVFVGRFDEIATRPEPLLVDVLRFIGVSADRRYIPLSVREPVNPTVESPVPERHRRFLEDLLADEIQSWRRTFR